MIKGPAVSLGAAHWHATTPPRSPRTASQSSRVSTQQGTIRQHGLLPSPCSTFRLVNLVIHPLPGPEESPASCPVMSLPPRPPLSLAQRTPPPRDPAPSSPSSKDLQRKEGEEEENDRGYGTFVPPSSFPVSFSVVERSVSEKKTTTSTVSSTSCHSSFVVSSSASPYTGITSFFQRKTLGRNQQPVTAASHSDNLATGRTRCSTVGYDTIGSVQLLTDTVGCEIAGSYTAPGAEICDEQTANAKGQHTKHTQLTSSNQAKDQSLGSGEGTCTLSEEKQSVGSDLPYYPPSDLPQCLASVAKEDLLTCECCGQDVLAWEMPEHNDYHFALDLQNSFSSTSTTTNTSLHSSSFSSVSTAFCPPLRAGALQLSRGKTRARGQSTPQPKRPRSQGGSTGTLDSFFKRS